MEEDFISSGLVSYMDDSWKTALDCFNKAVEKNASSFEAYLYRGCTNLKLGNYEEAIRDFNQGELIKSSNYDLFYNRGKAYLFNLEFSYAAKDFSSALEIENLTKEQIDNVNKYLTRLN